MEDVSSVAAALLQYHSHSSRLNSQNFQTPELIRFHISCNMLMNLQSFGGSMRLAGWRFQHWDRSVSQG